MLQSSCGTDLALVHIIASLGGDVSRLPCLLLPSGRRQKKRTNTVASQTNFLRASSRVFSPHDKCLSKPKGSLRGRLRILLFQPEKHRARNAEGDASCDIPDITVYLPEILPLLLFFSLTLEPIHCYPKRKLVLFS